MLPFFSFSRLVGQIRGFFTKKQPKVTKTFRPLAVSPTAAVQKPKRSSIKKTSPQGKTRSKRSPQFMKRLEIEIFGQRTPELVSNDELKQIRQPLRFHPAARTSRKSKKVDDGFKKQNRRVAGSRIVKHTNRPGYKKYQAEKKCKIFTKLDQDWRLLQLASSTFEMKSGFVEPASTISSTTSSNTTPAADPLGSPTIYKNKNLRGPDSKFAVPDFRPSAGALVLYDDSNAQAAAEQAHEEMQKELEYYKSSDEEQSIGDSSDEMEGVEFVVAEYQQIYQPMDISTDVVVQPAIEVEPMMLLPVTSSSFEVNMTDVSFDSVVPASVPLAVESPMFPQRTDIDMADVVATPKTHRAPLLATPNGIGGVNRYQVKTISPLNPAYGSQQQAATPASQAVASPPPTTTSTSTSTPTVAAPVKSSNTVKASRPLAPPAGARRAVPMNFVIGKSMQSTNVDDINTSVLQPQTKKRSATTAFAAPLDTTENDVGAASVTPLPLSPPSSPVLSPVETPTPAPVHTRTSLLSLKLQFGAQKIEKKPQVEPSYINNPTATWQPKTWERATERIEKCGTWRTPARTFKTSMGDQEGLVKAGDGGYDQDLEKVKVLISKMNHSREKAKVIKDVMSSVIEGCIGRDDVDVPLGRVEHVSSIPNIAGAAPGSTVAPFRPKKAAKMPQKKLDDFEDDMINMQLNSPRVWNSLIGFVLQKGCKIQQLLITEDVIEVNGQQIVEEDADIYHEVVGCGKNWVIDWRRVDDLALVVKHQIDVRREKYHEASDLAGTNRQDFNVLLRMIEREGYFEPFADQVKQWAVCHKEDFLEIARKAGLCEESELERLAAVKKWLWTVVAAEHSDFHWNIEACLQLRYRHWYERYGEEDEYSGSEELSM